MLCAFDSSRQEETGHRYVDFSEGNDGSGEAMRPVWMT